MNMFRKIFVTRALAKVGILKPIPLSVRLSAKKILNWLISSKLLLIEHCYLTCMVLVTSRFLKKDFCLVFDLLQCQMCCHARTTILPNSRV